MTDAHFDTMAAVQMLRQAGIADQQAEAIVTALVESQHNLATKDDVQQLEMKMEAGFAQMRTEMNAGFAQMRADMKTAIADSQRVMTLTLGSIVVGTALVAGGLAALAQFIL